MVIKPFLLLPNKQCHVQGARDIDLLGRSKQTSEQSYQKHNLLDLERKPNLFFLTMSLTPRVNFIKQFMPYVEYKMAILRLP
jgi:hypothetical protein